VGTGADGVAPTAGAGRDRCWRQSGGFAADGSSCCRSASLAWVRSCALPAMNFRCAAVANKTRHAANNNASTRIRSVRRAFCSGVRTICGGSGKSQLGRLSKLASAAPPSYCPRSPRLKNSRTGSSVRPGTAEYVPDRCRTGSECRCVVGSTSELFIRFTKIIDGARHETRDSFSKDLNVSSTTVQE
jgi:hypothetical protein